MRRPARRSSNRLGLIVLLTFVGLLAAAGIAAFKTLTFVSSVSTADLGDNIKSIVTNSSPSPSAAASKAPTPSGRINVLLLGYGGEGHDGADLTDSIMVLSFDQRTKQAAMISVPRDLWVKIPYSVQGGSYYKLNAAYAIGDDDDTFKTKKPEYTGTAGGGNLASAVVGDMLGMKIDYWVAVDFRAFKTVVDALGGVDVDVETAFTDYQYPRNDDPTIDASYMTVHFDAGMQHMSGDRALIYARSRHSLQDGTDFGRSRRQQKLLLAIKDKALSPDGMSKLFGLMDALSKNFKTNMNLGQMRALSDIARTVDVSAIDRVSIDDTNYLADAVTADGQAVLIPQARSWAPLRGYLASLLLDPAVKSENATVQLYTGSALTTAADSTTTMLKDMGLQTLPPQSYESGAVQQTEIHDLSEGKDSSTVNYLATMFDARVFTDTPSSTDHPDIKIVLGQAYQVASSPVDVIDPTVRLPGAYTPPATEIVRAQPKPALTPVLAPAASTSPEAAPSAVATASRPLPSVSVPTAPPVPASAAAKPAATPTAASRPPATPTAARR
ncbi:MAG TPA: LCP family protein [Chloroflexota bacterium]|nr:LCP family protein [Chloroflexota bacterium]